jgi:hypothetical protein
MFDSHMVDYIMHWNRCKAAGDYVVFLCQKQCNMAVGKLQIPALFMQSFIGSCPLCWSLMSNLKLVLVSL